MSQQLMWTAILIGALIAAPSVPMRAAPPPEAPALQASAACELATDELPALPARGTQSGYLDSSRSKCFGLPLIDGEFVRMSFSIESGHARLRIFGPDTPEVLFESWAWGAEVGYPTMPVAFRASRSGLHRLEVSAPGWRADTPAGRFILRLEQRLSADNWTARVAELTADQRTQWLRKNAVAIRSVDPDDDDFSDLESLRRELEGVRVVMLGESDHGAGTDLAAKARLVKFLHREMGFDVLAFESGLFEASVAWEALQSDMDPRQAFLKGIFGVWGLSEQVQPLIRYLASSARSRRPLELAGFDYQFTGTASPLLLPRLRQFLSENQIPSTFTDSSSSLSRALAGLTEYPARPERWRLTEAERIELTEALRALAEQVRASASGRQALFWRQVLRSAASQFDPSVPRDRQMAENLLWLSETYYPGRKVIAWLHTLHAVRMGDEGVRQALGDAAFVVGFTSYEGTFGCINCRGGFVGMRQDIGSDQDVSVEFEELMASAGFEFAFVTLRRPHVGGEWLEGNFVARPLLKPRDERWDEVFDGLFFIRTQAPSTRVAAAR